MSSIALMNLYMKIIMGNIMGTKPASSIPTMRAAGSTQALTLDASTMTPSDLEENMKWVLSTALAIWKDRQRKYGPRNIARQGAAGVLHKAADKLARLEHHYLSCEGTPAPQEEGDTILDGWLDGLNYFAMGAMLHLDLWPKLEELPPQPELVCKECGR